MTVPMSGLLLGGKVVPGGEWITRDGRAWWKAGDYGTKRRTIGQPIDLVVGHWTAGEAGVRYMDDDGPFIVEVMRNRPSNDPVLAAQGVKLKVSIHFVIGADGTTWQTADPLTTTAIHVGMGAVNDRSIGIEIVSPGTGPMHPARPRPTVRHRMLPTPKYPSGRLVPMRAYYPSQIDAWVRLVELLCSRLPIPRQVPRGADGGLEIDRFTKPEQRRWKGIQEHYHLPTTNKRDAGTQLIGALRDRGWSVVTP